MMADRSAPADTMLAMGEIAATPRAAGSGRPAASSPGGSPDFASPRGQARIGALTGGGVMKIFASYNIKGGVGKTATAVNIAYLAAADGYRVLLWDLDPQARRQLPVPGPAAGQGRREGADRGQAAGRRGDQGHRLR